MPTRAAQCSQRDKAAALADGTLPPEDVAAVQRHLERCELCRAAFRQQTAERFPRVRNYTILEEVGKGGFGVVYKAIHHGKERIEALKVLFGKTPLRQAYFENEVHLAARLRHPNIATLYDAHLGATPFYYALEFVEGETLDDYLRTHEVSLEDRIRIVQSVAGAIDYAHRIGVIHRDLKPQNILIDPDGEPRILDFGIAKWLGHPDGDTDGSEPADTGPEGALGTYGYMPPEQIAGQPVDRRSDVFSLGALLFHVITGQPARFAPQVRRLTEVLRERQVSRADDLAEIIAHCVETAPEERYPSCAALVADLDNYLTGRPIAARADPTPGYRVSRFGALMMRNHPWTLQVFAATAVAVLLTMIFATGGARWFTPGVGENRAALITFGPNTDQEIAQHTLPVDLPGLTASNRKSRRLLYGELLEHLADAHARAIVWDFYFPDEQPDYDPAFIRGMKDVGVPVVVGSARFDVNAEPIVAPDIRAAAHSWGGLYSANPGFLESEVPVPLALKRGFNPLAPSLAVAGFAAARHPDCSVNLQQEGQYLVLRYQKRDVAPGETRWLRETDRIPIFRPDEDTTGRAVAGTRGVFQEGDEILLGRFAVAGIVAWGERGIPFERVLAASPEQLRAWFEGRTILIGELAPLDRHALKSGQMIYGCQIHAQALDAMLAGASIGRVERASLIVRVVLWCALAVALAHLLPARQVTSLRRAGLVLGVIIALALFAATELAPRTNSMWLLEVGVAACALLMSGALAYLLRLAHLRQLRLTPGPIWSADETTVSTALLESLNTPPTSN